MKYSFFLVALFSIVLTACSSSHGMTGQRLSSVYDRVMGAGKIRAAYAIYPPFCMKDPNTGKMSGIGIETFELIAKKLGLSVQYTEEVGWGNLSEGLETNRYDMIAMPVWTNASRAKVSCFSKPICYHPLFAYARKGDKRFQKLENINSPNITITGIDGTTEDLIAQTDFPNAKHLAMPQLTDFSQDFLNVIDKKADILLAEPGVAKLFMKTNPDAVERVSPTPLRIFPVCWMLKRGEFELQAMWDTVLDEVINSGDMEKIIRKYEPDKSALFLVAKPYQLAY